ncbi:acetate uptake transporter family protein [Desulforhopalus singaporensis]|uniref:GPR1/FUN34/yaaH family protein n=1 Tax=Desulforhopalus singaporensis TaxID=91360 RepID=A0A1H0W2U3_9BACT|nr:GPR1/FUN34/YaaH family transporter [Desulforhopalus singaporensis]SDP85044.1 hypothetical protein SAMN05660330_04393 [Desulforhopalus singaporensis]
MSKKQNSFANPSPQALTALAIACFIFFGILTGEIGADSNLAVAIWLFGGFVCQFTAGIIELKDGNLTGGNVMLLFGSFFMLVTGLLKTAEFICHSSGIHYSIAPDPYAWLCLAIVLTIFTPAYLVGSPVFFLGLICADIALWLITFMKLGILSPAIAAPIAAYSLLTLGLIAIYLASAVVLNNSFKRTVLPVGKPIIAVE